MGLLPWASTGSGPPVVLLAGLSPSTGVASERAARALIGPLSKLADRRRIFVVNRRAGLPPGFTMGELALEHARGLLSYFDEPVDVVGLSTGGSIAQQLAADHPDVVRRLVLISAACRLGPVGRELQSRLAHAIAAGDTRRAGALVAAGLAPRMGNVARGVGWLVGPRLFPPSGREDLVTTLLAEDGFDLARCPEPIRARTLVIAGGQDRFYGEALFRETQRLISDADLALFPNRGHLSVTRDRRALAQLAGFLTWEPGDAITR
jgi:pimeloyl-ACP methyl ester carboxylesterase